MLFRSSGVLVGGFDVVVYDQFGTLSITRWGSEISIKDAQILFHNYNHYRETHNDDDDEIHNDDNDVDTTNFNSTAILDSQGK